MLLVLLVLPRLGCYDAEPPPRLPLQVVSQAPSGGARRQVLANLDPDASGVALTWLSLSPLTRSALAQEFSVQAQRLRMSTNPLWVDLEDAPDPQALRAVTAALLPSLTAAGALLPGQWQTPEGALHIKIVSCPPPYARCTAQLPEEDKLGQRTRFAAWALTRALLVQASSAAIALQAARALQDRVLVADAPLGLVLWGGEPTEDAKTEAQDTVQKLAAQLVQVELGEELLSLDLLRGLAQLPRHPRLPRWLPLAAEQVLVVPRLSSQFAEVALRTEVSERLAAVGVLAQVRIGPALY